MVKIINYTANYNIMQQHPEYLSDYKITVDWQTPITKNNLIIRTSIRPNNHYMKYQITGFNILKTYTIKKGKLGRSLMQTVLKKHQSKIDDWHLNTDTSTLMQYHLYKTIDFKLINPFTEMQIIMELMQIIKWFNEEFQSLSPNIRNQI